METFKPKFTHQIFEEDKIVGYKNLKVDIYVDPISFVCLVKETHTSKLPKCEDIHKLLWKHFPIGKSKSYLLVCVLVKFSFALVDIALVLAQREDVASARGCAHCVAGSLRSCGKQDPPYTKKLNE